MAFNPNSLTPLGPPRPVARETLGISEDQWQNTPASEKQMTQQFRGQDGKTYTAIIDPRVGKPLAFVSERPGKEYERTYLNPQTGQWETQVAKKKGYNPVKDVLSDGKFMAFLAVVAGGVAASYAAGGSAGVAGGASASTAGTGAAPSMGGMGAYGGGTTAAATTAAPITQAVPSAGGGSTTGGSSLYSAGGDMGMSAGAGTAGSAAAPAATTGSGGIMQAVQQIATKYGGSVAQWAMENPQLAASLGGAVLGYLGNKDDATSSATVTTQLDPVAQAQREHVIRNINQYAAQTPTYGAGRTPGGVNWGGVNAMGGAAPAPMQKSMPAGAAPMSPRPLAGFDQAQLGGARQTKGSPMMGGVNDGRMVLQDMDQWGRNRRDPSFGQAPSGGPQQGGLLGGANPSLGIQGGTLADFQPGGRFGQGAVQHAMMPSAPIGGPQMLAPITNQGGNFAPITASPLPPAYRPPVRQGGQIGNMIANRGTAGTAPRTGGQIGQMVRKSGNAVAPRQGGMIGNMIRNRGTAGGAAPVTSGPAAGGGMPDWGGSNNYMPQVNQYLQQGTAGLGATGNANMGRAGQYLDQGTAQINAQRNAEMDAVRRYMQQATAQLNATQNNGISQANDYFRQGTGVVDAAGNPLAYENNPYLTGMLESASKDMQKFYESQIAPKFSSGSSFGNSGLGFLEVRERDNQADQFSQMASGLRAGDHALRAQLLESLAGRKDAMAMDRNGNLIRVGQALGDWGEQSANRQDQLNNAGRSNALSAGQIVGNLGESYAGRQDSLNDARANRLVNAGQVWGNLGESAAGRQDQLNNNQRSNYLTAAGTWGQLGQNAGQFNATFDFNKWQAEQDERNRRMQALLQSGGLPGGTTVTQSSTAQGNPWAGAAGGAIAGANIWKQWSDPNQRRTIGA